jgi:ribonucleoside-diphosphate reductase alpha chain
MKNENLITYSEKEVRIAAVNYFNGNTLAADVWMKKYCLKDADNYYELTPNDMHRRIAKELARIESKYPNGLSEDEIFETIKEFQRIVPQGSPMSGIGNDFQVVSLSNCYVIGNEGETDSYGGIFKIDQEIAQLEKRRGGVGTDLSFLRPYGSPVKNTAITSTGVVPFMERYSNTTKEVAQDGRRGALMLSIDVHHPDTEKFIDAKLEQGKVTGANISVKLTDDFMEAALNNKPFNQTYPIYSPNPTFTKEIDANKLWKKIIHNAWKSAEPGILYWSKIKNESIPDCYSDYGFATTSTNPCGEIPLCPYDSCRLLSVNLYGYVNNPFCDDSNFNYDLFKSDVIKAMRYMDDIVDLEIEKIEKILEKIKSDPEDEFIKLYEIKLWENILEKTRQGRRTGLGITGLGDMLAALGYRYGTEKANLFIGEIQKLLKLTAYRSSVEMAKERGSFPIYDGGREVMNPFIKRIYDEDPDLYTDMVTYGRRNIALLTIAPTGTVSIMTETTSGCEPVFSPVYTRRRKINPQEKNVRVDFIDDEGISWTEYPVFHHKFIEWLKVKKYDIDSVMMLNKTELEKLVELSPYYKSTSNDVDWVKKVEMQGILQSHVDHSISVTVNLPNDVSEDIVSKVYETGWKCGCKGMTVYRDGSRQGVLITENDKKSKEKEDSFRENNAPKRPKRLKGEIHRFQNGSEKWIAVVGIWKERPYEIFTGRYENGLSNLPSYLKECVIVKNVFEDNGERRKRYDIEYIDQDGKKQVATGLSHKFHPDYWNYAKMISGVLRHGMPLVYTYELVNSLNLHDENLNTWKNGMVRVIKRYIKDGEKIEGKKCPDCGSTHIEFKEGCLTCMSCGNSKCS